MADDQVIAPPPQMPSWMPLAMMVLGSGLGGMKYGSRDRSWNFGAPFRALGDYGGYMAQTGMQQSALEQERKRLMEMQEGLAMRERARKGKEWSEYTTPIQAAPLQEGVQGPPAPARSRFEESLYGDPNAIANAPEEIRADLARAQIEKPKWEASLEEKRREADLLAKRKGFRNVPGVGLVDVTDEEGPEVVIKANPPIGKTGSSGSVVNRIEEKMVKGEELSAGERAVLERHTKATKSPAPGKPSSLNKEGLGVMAWDALLFGKNPPGMGNASAEMRSQVANERARIGKSLGLSPMEMAMLPQDNRVKMKAVDALTKWGAFVDKSSEQVTRSMDVAIEYARKIDPTTLQSLNKAIIAGKREFNDPTVNAYAVAINTVRNEYGRLMAGPTSNAMLPVEAMKKGDELISSALDVPSLIEMKKVLLRDANITTSSVKHQRDMLHDSITGLGKEKVPASGKASAPVGPPTTYQDNDDTISRAEKLLEKY